MNAVASQISSLINGLEGEEGPAPKLAKVDFPDGERLRKGGFVVSPEDGAVEVFTDGACEGNGKASEFMSSQLMSSQSSEMSGEIVTLTKDEWLACL